jgi:hypothetical protein
MYTQLLSYGWALYWRLCCHVAVLCSGWFGFLLPWVSVLVLAGLVPCFGLELSFVTHIALSCVRLLDGLSVIDIPWIANYLPCLS